MSTYKVNLSLKAVLFRTIEADSQEEALALAKLGLFDEQGNMKTNVEGLYVRESNSFAFVDEPAKDLTQKTTKQEADGI